MKTIFKNIISISLALIIVAGAFATNSCKVNAKGETKEQFAAVFDATYYASAYPDLKAVFGNDANALFNHFVQYGMAEGRQGSAEFNVNIYRKKYADLNAVFGNDLKLYYVHYVQYGKAEGRTAKAEAAKKQETKNSAVAFNKTEDMVSSAIYSLKSSYQNGGDFPPGKKYVWYGGIVYEGVNEDAFAFRLSDEAFGQLLGRKVYGDYNYRTGDIVKLNQEKDTAIIVKAFDQYVLLAEIDNGKICWDVYRTKRDLNDQLSYYITRYPQ